MCTSESICTSECTGCTGECLSVQVSVYCTGCTGESVCTGECTGESCHYVVDACGVSFC